LVHNSKLGVRTSMTAT